MSVEPTDADLVQQIAAGQRDAEAEMCRRMAPRIRLFALRHLRSAPAADDLVQQVLLATIEALRAGRLRDSDKLAHFVLGTCKMTVLALRRNARRQDELLGQYGDILVPDHAAAPSVDSDRLARCVQQLKERERSVIVMSFYDEQTSGESARSLGLSEANLRVIRHRAIRQLRTCMEPAS